MPESQVDFLSSNELMTRDEIITITKLMARNGICKVKLTGGEPLLRKDLVEIVQELKAIDGIEQITLTTNGILLKDKLKELVEAGISSVNISIDSRNPEHYHEITKRNVFEQAWTGLMEALKYPEISVKVNCVPIDCSPENITEMAELARDHKLSVRFIEMMPIGYGVNYQRCDEEYIKSVLEQAYGPVRLVDKKLGNGPARYYEIDGFQGKIGFISAVSHKFCSDCNRIRLTSEGLLKTCLQYGGQLNLKELLRQGISEEELEGIIGEEVKRKPHGHHFNEQSTDQDEKKYLGSIGG
jgi:cyclic pyranopterin phosphate synthase